MMGISVAIENAAYPHITLTLECDADPKVMFCRGFETFNDAEGFISCHKAAMAHGWLERNTSKGRIWLCPACSGKAR